jgi:hypothetical protein
LIFFHHIHKHIFNIINLFYFIILNLNIKKGGEFTESEILYIEKNGFLKIATF